MIFYTVINYLLIPLNFLLFLLYSLFKKKKNNKIIIILGNYASATTLNYQILSSLTNLNFINNISGKFYKNLLIGQIINKIIYSFLDRSSNYKSSIGLTDGYLEPNEFGWFWRKFFWKKKRINLRIFLKEIEFLKNFQNKNFLLKYSFHKNNRSLIQIYNYYFKYLKEDILIINPIREKKQIINSLLNRLLNLKITHQDYKLSKSKNIYYSINNQVNSIDKEIGKFINFFPKKNIYQLNLKKLKNNKNQEIKKMLIFLEKNGISIKDKSFVNKEIKKIKFRKNVKNIK